MSVRSIRSLRLCATVIVSAILAGCSGASSPPVLPAQSAPFRSFVTRELASPLGPRSIVSEPTRSLALCARSEDPSRAACMASVRVLDAQASQNSIAGLVPTDISNLYGFPALSAQGSAHAIVGIVVAYDYAGAESDLATYRAHFGLPACSTANGCFKKVGAAAATVTSTNAQGQPQSVSAHPTSPNSGWAAEADADLEAASAVCKNCQIVLAESASDSLVDLAAAVHAAVAAGATVVNASFGAPEDSSQAALESAFEPAPVKVVAAAGDAGRGAMFPAAASNVVAVAGTSLNVLGLLVTESLWSGSGGGCSSVFARPSYEPFACGSKRSIADIAAVADPADGLAVYDSGIGGWVIVGGTSIAAPIVSGMFALSGDTTNGAGAQELYAHALLHYLPVLGGGAIAGNGTPTGLAAF